MIYSSLTRGFVMRLFQGAAYKPKSAFIKKMSDGTCPPINIRRCSCTSDGLSVSPKKSLTSPIWDRRPSKILDENHLPKQLLVQHHHEDGAFLRNISATELVLEVQETAGTQQIGAPSALPESRVLVLYTGGTIGMKTTDGVYCPVPGYLPEVLRDIPPLNDRRYIEESYSNVAVRPYSLPPVRNMKKRVVYWIVEYEPLLDSCDMTFDDWIRIATDIKKAYHKYDGFVVLHGTDTLAYTASALSFMMENLGKPVIITGSQIPVAEVRSDGMENLIGALITAGNFDIPEVCVYFNNKLMRGNRTVKLDNSALEAFDSPNMHPLAQMAINIKVNYDSIFRSDMVAAFTVHENLCRDVGMLRIFPSMTIESVRAFLQPPTRGCILQTFGSGNMPTRRQDIIMALKEAIARGVMVVNCSQCLKGQVDVNYATGKILYDIGVIPGSDMTSEAAMAKLCYVLGKDEWDLPMKRSMLQSNLRGEMTIASKGAMRELDIIPHIAKCLRVSSSQEVQLLRDIILPPMFCNAAKTNDVEILKSLKAAGVNFSATDYNLRTALHVAASNGHLESVNYLLKIGTNVHIKDMFGYNALVCAVKAKAMDCIIAIRDAGGFIDASAQKIGVELCLAVYQNDMELLKCNEAAGTHMGEKDYDNRTALHVAASLNKPEIVAYLLQCGLNPHEKDDFGITPMDEAKRRNLQNLMDMMAEHQALTNNDEVFHLE
ncbi:asparaginase [Caenorhabditis elegans]|uniref:asparaginase n=1 Tax=Caenorhabditis elegans TaxID=6239 RepID=Q9U3P0_CAEEL|nr:asparaginase [Caenorhabditis elegans]CAB02790.1 asparaginase [Caenorhabditis elegans]|eukprot:NP_506048.1 Uncharacterized protein CELE_C27A7.5 [Caenorhabditis elegans]